MPPKNEQRPQHERGRHERKHEQRAEATRRPLDLRAAHRREQLLALALGFAGLPVLGRAERREEHECACDPEEREY